MLHHWCAAAAGVLVEQRLGGLAADDAIGDRIRVLLEAIALLADAALELHAALLLDDVRCLVPAVCRSGDVRNATASPCA